MTVPLPRSKRILFTLLPALALLCIIAAIEAGLRLFAPSLDVPLVTVERLKGEEWYQINRRYLERYFPPGIVLLPEFKPTLFRRAKAPSTFRVFCLGESSMFGSPYQMSATIPAILRLQLRRLLPGREVEVINLGASAINSNVIADVAHRIPEFAPDLVVLYAGHNEFYGPDGVGASWPEKKLPFLTRWKYRLRDLRIARLITRWIGGRAAAGGDHDERNLMKIVSRGALVPSGSPDEARVYANFERNLEEIAQTFRTAGIPLIVSDVTSNLMFPPFAPESAPGFDDIARRVESGNGPDVLHALEAASASDTSNAFLTYWRGRCLLAGGDTAGAVTFLRRARDLDLLKFRATQTTNAIIHRVCVRQAVPCVGADSLFRALSPGGIPAENLFWEHLHPRAEGYYHIAGLLLSATVVEHLLPLPGVPVTRPVAMIPFDTDSLAIPWIDLAYADLSMRQLTTHWPFQHFQAPAVVMPSASDALRKIATDVYTLAISWDAGCYQTALEFRREGRLDRAATTYRALIEDWPINGQAHYLLANVYKESGNLNAACGAYEASIRLEPGYPYARIELGLILTNLGRFDEAIAQLQKALELLDASAPAGARASACYGLSAAYANTGDFPSALRWIDESVRLAPGYQPALKLQARLRATHH